MTTKTINMRSLISNILYIIGIVTMFYPAISGKPHLSHFLIPAGIIFCVCGLVIPPEKTKTLDDSILDSHLTKNHKFDIWSSEDAKNDFSKIIRKETWDKGIPMIYMNEYGQVIRHWSDGKIEIIKSLGDETEN